MQLVYVGTIIDDELFGLNLLPMVILVVARSSVEWVMHFQ